MSHYHSYLNSATAILSQYHGGEPFASFIKKYFAQHKKFGSRDRKQISHLCYCYFRPGKAMTGMPTAERVMAGLFLCTTSPDAMLEAIKPEWNEKVGWPVADKLSLLHADAAVTDVFPWPAELSEGIDAEAFAASSFIQPGIFLRVRPGKKSIVEKKLNAATIQYTTMNDSCFELPSSSKIDTILSLNKEAVVQDFNSQRVGGMMEYVNANQPGPVTVWDCCAASGGKSIMATDILGDIDLTVSDVRQSILSNLKKRFKEAGIVHYRSLLLDLSKENSQSPLNNTQFSLIIADVPCTGSGTWGRTPEQLFFFDIKKVDDYAALQKKIVANALTLLEKGGYLLYITCSVFKKENEEMVDYIKEKFQLQVVQLELLKGYDKRADTMFAALLQRPL